ncbi:MAG TPA: KR domain-containing protein, partial [Nostocaceae cyanobacterium]|nr:KR domain-containing protein [Nostocaceae cyanobacterium]
GQIDYVGANAFLDAFAHYKTSTDATFTVAINWDAWQEVGMAAKGRGAEGQRSTGRNSKAERWTGGQRGRGERRSNSLFPND